MALTAQQIAEQRKDVEELIAGPDVGFAKALFFGKFKGELLYPYPTLPADKQAAADQMAATVKNSTSDTVVLSVLVIEHDMKFVEDIAHKVTVLHQGQILSEGSMDKVKNDPKVIEVYLGH